MQVCRLLYYRKSTNAAGGVTTQYGQGGARGGGGAKAAYGSVYTATTAAASYPSQPYTAPAAQPAKREYTHTHTRRITPLWEYYFPTLVWIDWRPNEAFWY